VTNTTQPKKFVFFNPANGIPAQTYSSFLTKWTAQSGFTIVTYDYRGFGQTHTPARTQTHWGWPVLRQDALEIFAYVQSLLPNATGIWAGHSMGAWLCLFAAQDLKSQYEVILLDPPLLTPRVIFGWCLLRLFNKKENNFRSRLALRRKIHYPSLTVAKEQLATKSFFKHWNSQALEDYIEGSFYTEVNGSLTLRHSPTWESHLFANYPPFASFAILKNLSCKTRKNLKGFLLAGAKSSALYLPARIWFERLLPGIRWKVLEGADHMFPFERESECVESVVEGVAKLSVV
jgi:pimeloyl-ACP methyl ester carboxylesterase